MYTTEKKFLLPWKYRETAEAENMSDGIRERVSAKELGYLTFMLQGYLTFIPHAHLQVRYGKMIIISRLFSRRDY